MRVPTPKKTHTVPSSGHKYSYIYYPTTFPTKPTLLFLHGFPSTSHDWRHQILHFRSQGYGILAPDLLGYGETSKPSSPSSYVGSIMSDDIISILDHEDIKGGVVGIAHDWGTYLLSQLIIYYPERLEKVIFMSAPFAPPGRAMDVHALNKYTKKKAGYEQYGYWLFLTEEEAGKTIGKHWSSFFDIAFCADPTIWKTAFAPTNALKDSITTNAHPQLASYITPADKAHHHAVFGNDYSSCLTWYKRGIDNLGVDGEIRMLKEGKIKNGVPMEALMITGTKDAVCSAGRAEDAMKKVCEAGKLSVVHFDAGHWVMMEREREVNEEIGTFLENGARGVEEKWMKASL